jgi:hypothetical protein
VTTDMTSVVSGYGTDGFKATPPSRNMRSACALAVLCVSKDSWIGVKSRLPESIDEHSHAGRIRAVLEPRTPQHRTQFHHFEVTAVYMPRGDNLLKCAEFLDGVEPGADVLNFRNREYRFVTPISRALWRT